MRANNTTRRLSLIALCVCLLAVTVLFAVPAAYTPVQRYALAFVQIVVLAVAAWGLGASAIRSEGDDRRRLAASGSLLILTWALSSFLSGFGRPDEASVTQNHLRYVILLVDALGYAAILVATPMYLIWASILLGAYTAMQNAGTTHLPPAFRPLVDVSELLLFFGGAFTYVATAAFAVALCGAKWFGRGATITFASTSFFALFCLVVRGLAFPDPHEVFTQWYLIPGYIAGIPAVPWIMPTLFGVMLLRRAGSE